MQNKLWFIIFICFIVIFLSIISLISSLKHTRKYKKQYKEIQQNVQEKEAKAKDIANRRNISAKEKEDIMKRDNYTCQICGISRPFFDQLCPGSGDYLLLEVDHIISVANGGSRDASNLQTLCWKCNRKKGSKKTNQDVYNMIDYGIKYLNK